jgi:CrcB protein
MIPLLFVVAAALGGAARFVVEYRWPPVGQNAFPRATLAVNIAGSFILGLVFSAPSDIHLIIGTALCGALTTFSGVSLQMQKRFAAGANAQAFKYLLLLLISGISVAALGMWLGSYIF